MILQFTLDSPTFYRYFSPRGIDTLESLRLKISPPNEFNDPFEFLPKVEPVSREDYAHLLASNQECKKAWEETNTGESFEAFQLRFKEELLRDGSELSVLSGYEEYQGELKAQRDSYLHTMSRVRGLVCYSEVPDDILMWGHYTQCHQGLVIGFDANHSFFRGNNIVLPVLYRSERVGATIGEDGSLELREGPEIFFRSKSLHWSYEKEWRQFFPLNESDRVVAGDGTALYFQKLPAEAIQTVILGMRCSSELSEKIRRVLEQPKFSHVLLQRAEPHERDFRLSLVKS